MNGVEISAKTDYAVRAMLALAEAEPEQPVSVDTLAQSQGLPRKFLESILADLRRAELVRSTKGARGGYRLSLPPSEIAIGAIFRAVDGPLAEVRGLRPHQTAYEGVAAHLPHLWVAVRASLRQVLDDTSLQQLLDGRLPEHVRDLAGQPDAWLSR